MTTGAVPASALSGPDLRVLFASAASWLERNAAAVNAINVFPVPDGDTGTNMALTLRAAVDESQRAPDSVAAVVEALARGALMGARGNSGVILSQYLRGLAERLTAATVIDGPRLADALAAAAATAYRAVTNPAEGTILTVAREASEAAARAGLPDATVEQVWQAAVVGARAALARTPDLLPVLREAGVVDSGGLGLCVTLEGALLGLRGQPLPETGADAGHIKEDWLDARREAHAGASSAYGYCVEFTIRDAAPSVDDLRAALAGLGGSLLVVGDAHLYHIHIHAEDPGPALSAGARAGRLTGVKVEDMDEQAARLTGAVPDTTTATGPYGVIAVAAGTGLAQSLREAGAAAVVAGGQTMNPSTRDLLDAVQAIAAERVILLPNNKNIIWTAEQAAKLAARPVHVVATRSIPQGLAALLALNPDDTPEDAIAAMTAAAGRVRTIEVTRAARTVTFQGINVREGEPIALVDDVLAAAGPTDQDAALAALRSVEVGEGALVTVFRGSDTDEAVAQSLATAIRAAWPDWEVEVRAGLQPFYSYIISVE